MSAPRRKSKPTPEHVTREVDCLKRNRQVHVDMLGIFTAKAKGGNKVFAAMALQAKCFVEEFDRLINDAVAGQVA